MPRCSMDALAIIAILVVQDSSDEEAVSCSHVAFSWLYYIYISPPDH